MIANVVPPYPGFSSQQPQAPTVIVRECVIQCLNTVWQLSSQLTGSDVIVLASIENGSIYPTIGADLAQRYLQPTNFIWWTGIMPYAIALQLWTSTNADGSPSGLQIPATPDAGTVRLVLAHQSTRTFIAPTYQLTIPTGFSPTLAWVGFES